MILLNVRREFDSGLHNALMLLKIGASRMSVTPAPRALIVHGGWPGHEPSQIADLLASSLREAGFAVELSDTLAVFDDAGKLASADLVVPCWTMGTLTPEQTANLCGAVRGGTGLAGVHGGMGDAFRGNLDYEWMTGGHFVGHPHVGDYAVRRTALAHEITAGLPDEFAYSSEQYYLLVDPGIEVLADTIYEHEGRRVTMPVVWIKQWGAGRVFYSALGHAVAEFERFPVMAEIVRRGLVWAARK